MPQIQEALLDDLHGEELEVRGRGDLTAQILVQHDHGEVFIRLDDNTRPEFWAEVHITPSLMARLAEAFSA